MSPEEWGKIKSEEDAKQRLEEMPSSSVYELLSKVDMLLSVGAFPQKSFAAVEEVKQKLKKILRGNIVEKGSNEKSSNNLRSARDWEDDYPLEDC